MKKLLPLLAVVLGATLLVVYKSKSAGANDELWKQATAS